MSINNKILDEMLTGTKRLSTDCSIRVKNGQVTILSDFDIGLLDGKYECTLNVEWKNVGHYYDPPEYDLSKIQIINIK